MRAMQAGDDADLFASSGVEHQHLRATSNVKAMSWWIGEQVIPAAIAANLPFVDDLVRLLRGKLRRHGEQAAEKRCGKDGEDERAGVSLELHVVSKF
jgi:hypothetical protein